MLDPCGFVSAAESIPSCAYFSCEEPASQRKLRAKTKKKKTKNVSPNVCVRKVSDVVLQSTSQVISKAQASGSRIDEVPKLQGDASPGVLAPWETAAKRNKRNRKPKSRVGKLSDIEGKEDGGIIDKREPKEGESSKRDAPTNVKGPESHSMSLMKTFSRDFEGDRSSSEVAIEKLVSKAEPKLRENKRTGVRKKKKNRMASPIDMLNPQCKVQKEEVDPELVANVLGSRAREPSKRQIENQLKDDSGLRPLSESKDDLPSLAGLHHPIYPGELGSVEESPSPEEARPSSESTPEAWREDRSPRRCLGLDDIVVDTWGERTQLRRHKLDPRAVMAHHKTMTKGSDNGGKQSDPFNMLVNMEITSTKVSKSRVRDCSSSPENQAAKGKRFITSQLELIAQPSYLDEKAAQEPPLSPQGGQAEGAQRAYHNWNAGGNWGLWNSPKSKGWNEYSMQSSRSKNYYYYGLRQEQDSWAYKNYQSFPCKSSSTPSPSPKEERDVVVSWPSEISAFSVGDLSAPNIVVELHGAEQEVPPVPCYRPASAEWLSIILQPPEGGVRLTKKKGTKLYSWWKCEDGFSDARGDLSSAENLKNLVESSLSLQALLLEIGQSDSALGLSSPVEQRRVSIVGISQGAVLGFWAIKGGILDCPLRELVLPQVFLFSGWLPRLGWAELEGGRGWKEGDDWKKGCLMYCGICTKEKQEDWQQRWREDLKRAEETEEAFCLNVLEIGQKHSPDSKFLQKLLKRGRSSSNWYSVYPESFSATY